MTSIATPKSKESISALKSNGRWLRIMPQYLFFVTTWNYLSVFEIGNPDQELENYNGCEGGFPNYLFWEGWTPS